MDIKCYFSSDGVAIIVKDCVFETHVSASTYD